MMIDAKPGPVASPPARSMPRCAAIGALWAVAVGSGTAVFFGAGSGTGGEPFDALNFAGVLGVAGATSAATTLGIGGRRRWAVEVAATASALIAGAGLAAYLGLWAYPGTARARLGLWPFRSLQQLAWSFGHQLPRWYLPMAIPVGAVAGGVAGLLALLARRRPGPAMAAGVAMLLAAAIGPIQGLAFGLVLRWGREVRWRLSGLGISGLEMSNEHISASGAISGALAGALLACLALRLAGRPVARPPDPEWRKASPTGGNGRGWL